ncbi:MAG TPA: hypothetical protein VHO28_12750 [Ignavibacteriales bacterium]|nr:hypothetical protein [Ignavibacteriales bacterium]HEX3074460.1 hypothetical protein [Ignavibacteriales bacterium]
MNTLTSPLAHNILISAASIIYVFAVVAIMDRFVKRGFPKEFSRKIVHIAAGSLIIFWAFYDHSHWSKYLNIAPTVIWGALLLIKGFFASSNDEAVKTMTREGDRRELLRGPFYFTLVMNFMGIAYLNTPAGITAIAFLGWGDGLAPIIGRLYGKTGYNVLAYKTVEGSLAFNIAGIAAAIVFNMLILGSFNLNHIILCGIAATIIEAVSPKDLDNLLIPAIILFFYEFLF